MSVKREGDNLIVEGLVEHGVYPTAHEEIDTTVILSGDYTVHGGIYGRCLKAAGSGTVHGPVVTRDDLVLDERELQRHVFLSGLTCPGVIRNEVPAYRIDQSCVRNLASARLRVRGPVMANAVHLSNALIIGNVHARTITLDACVVFGIIECEELLVLNTCNFVAYRAGRVRLLGRLTTWLGYGIAYDGVEFIQRERQRPHVEPARDPQGTGIPGDIRFLPICLSRTACAQTDDFETCDLYHDGRCPSAVSGRGLVLPNTPKVSLMDLDFQLHVVPRPGRDVEVDVRYRADEGTPRDERMRLSGIHALIARGVNENAISIKTGPEIWVPCRQADAFSDFDPTVEARYEKDGRSERRSLRLAAVAGLLGQGVDPSSLEMSVASGEWEKFYAHPVFRDRYTISRVLSVTGRLLDGRAIRQALADIRDLANRIAHYPYLDPASQNEVTREQYTYRSTRELFDFGIAAADVRPVVEA